jgi:hypothetical protein
MFAQHVMSAPILRPRPDRRNGERFAHREPVEIDGRRVLGCDISERGLSVFMQAPVSVGSVVRVTVQSGTGPFSPRRARVTRVDARPGRYVVGLEFIR